MDLTFEITCGLVLEALRESPSGEYAQLCEDVTALAAEKGFLPAASTSMPPPGVWVGTSSFRQLSSHDQSRIGEMVRQAMWRYLVRGVLVFGLDNDNPNWPWYQLTPVGHRAVKEGNPQPYDPDGFVEFFKKAVAPSGDPVVLDYLTEAVHTFNADCVRASAVMLGAASEKLILLVVEALAGAIVAPEKRKNFDAALNGKWMISHKYKVLAETLGQILTSKKVVVPKHIAEFINGELPSGYELLRRVRNSAGHPEAAGDVTTDMIFMNLRFFSEYARRMGELLAFLVSSKVDW